MYILLGTIPYQGTCESMIFLFSRWDMLVSWSWSFSCFIYPKHYRISGNQQYWLQIAQPIKSRDYLVPKMEKYMNILVTCEVIITICAFHPCKVVEIPEMEKPTNYLENKLLLISINLKPLKPSICCLKNCTFLCFPGINK